MSETNPSAPAPPSPPITTPVAAVDSLKNPTFILAVFAMVVVAATVCAVIYKGDEGDIKLVLGFVFGALGGQVANFYFGSSKGSQLKDAAQQPQQPTA